LLTFSVSQRMKNCDYCGRPNDDAVARCHEYGSSTFAPLSHYLPIPEPRKPDTDEIPLAAIVQKDGSAITLKCRTPEEAYLVCDGNVRFSLIVKRQDEVNHLRNAAQHDAYGDLKHGVFGPEPHSSTSARRPSKLARLYSSKARRASVSATLFTSVPSWFERTATRRWSSGYRAMKEAKPKVLPS